VDLRDPAQRTVFFDVHRDLPREAPGSRASTARALGFISAPASRASTHVLDVGCGPGKQTLDLAELLPNATLVAVDAHQPYLAEVRRRARLAGFAHRIDLCRADMRALPFAPRSFDIIWCEGAAYIMGFRAALEAWSPLLAVGGYLAVTEAVWLRRNPPEPVARNWQDYPAMTDVEGCRRRITDAGLRLIGDFVLEPTAWWDDYYVPMAERIAKLAAQHHGDPVAEHVLAACRAEIATYRDYGDYYGYAFFVTHR